MYKNRLHSKEAIYRYWKKKKNPRLWVFPPRFSKRVWSWWEEADPKLPCHYPALGPVLLRKWKGSWPELEEFSLGSSTASAQAKGEEVAPEPQQGSDIGVTFSEPDHSPQHCRPLYRHSAAALAPGAKGKERGQGCRQPGLVTWPAEPTPACALTTT